MSLGLVGGTVKVMSVSREPLALSRRAKFHELARWMEVVQCFDSARCRCNSPNGDGQRHPKRCTTIHRSFIHWEFYYHANEQQYRHWDSVTHEQGGYCNRWIWPFNQRRQHWF